MTVIVKNITNGDFISDCFDGDDDDDQQCILNKTITLNIDEKFFDTTKCSGGEYTAYEFFMHKKESEQFNKNEKLGFLLDLYNRSKANQRADRKLYFIDSVLSATLFAVLQALYWWSTWGILDEFLLPNDALNSTIVSYFLGLIVLLPNYMLQDKFQEVYDRQNECTKQFLGTIHIYIVGWAYTLQWRGVWNIIDTFITFHYLGNIFILLLTGAYLLIMRSFCYMTSAPFVLVMDTHEYSFASNNRYKLNRIKSKYVKYAFDFVATEVVECFVMNIFWRRAESICDGLIYPDDVDMNIAVSLSLGYLIYFALVACQKPLYANTSGLSLFSRLVIEDTFYLFMFASICILWRIYDLVPETYILSENKIIEAYLVSHFLSFFITVCLSASAIIVGTTFNVKDGRVNDHRTYFMVKYLADV